jgi:hypothetical protein
MGIAERIVRKLADSANRCRVRRVQAGLIYTAVQLDTGAVGVAYTYPRPRACGGTGYGGAAKAFACGCKQCVEVKARLWYF